MTGRAAVHRLTTRLDVTFERIDQLDADLEIRADFARYLCVLVSGYVENAVAELLMEHCRRTSGPGVQRFVEHRLERFTNPNAQRVGDLLGQFQTEWRSSFDTFVVDERKAALDSALNLRNSVAHGQSIGVTYSRIQGYYEQIKLVIGYVADLCDPV